MTDAKKLGAVIKQAIERGWKSDRYVFDDVYGLAQHDGDGGFAHVSWQEILFNHDFAKAFWGEREFEYKKIDDVESILIAQPGWKYHLQPAVISDNPIDYYYEHMEGKA